MKASNVLRGSAFTLLLMSLVMNAKTQNIGLGTNNPRVKLHIVNGAEGSMGFPFETLVVERTDDSKLGLYSTSSNPVNYNASSVALGFSKYLNSNGYYPSYEMQYGVWDNAGFMLRFNSLNRSANGNYLPNQSYSNVLCLDTKGQVGINLTMGQAVAPVKPTANLHVNGTVRFENLPPAIGGGNYLVVDANGNVKVSAGFVANRPASSSSSSNPGLEIESLKKEIAALVEKVLLLEKQINE